MPFKIDPERWYDEAELRLEGLFTEAALRRARASGALRCREPARGKRLYKGAWLLAWLEGRPPAEEGGPRR